MKLVDILARELKVWPDDLECAHQDHDGEIRFYGGKEETIRFDFMAQEKAHDRGVNRESRTGSRITRAEWQAAVDALNAPKVVEWDGAGNPAMGSSIEYSIGDGWYPCQVRYVLSRDDYPGIALVAWCEHLGKDQYLSNDRDHRFRPDRTAEQVAAEEREKAVADLYFTINWSEGRETWPFISNGRKADYEKAIDAGYRKEPKPCGS